MLSLICYILPHRRGMTPDEQIVTELLYMVKVNMLYMLYMVKVNMLYMLYMVKVNISQS